MGVDLISLLENRHRVDGNSRKAMSFGYIEGYFEQPSQQQYQKISRDVPYFRVSGHKISKVNLAYLRHSELYPLACAC